jgi:leucine dehydrogenase
MSTVLDQQLVLEDLHVPDYERVIKVTHKEAGLTAIISIHNRSLSSVCMGGTRIYPYVTFEEALNDVLRLSKGMTYKSALAECPWGGAKSCIILDPKKGLTREMLHAFAEALNTLQGIYICAEDVGCSPDTLAIVAEKTPYVVGLTHSKSSGNPSPYTAWGVFRGIQAVMQTLFNTDSVAGRTVAIQGVGSVGSKLAEFLFWHGAKLVLTDRNMEAAEILGQELGATVVEPDEIYDVPCDVFAPCALGGVINEKTMERLRCRAVAGATNNPLLTENDGEALMRAGILYAPDFVINAGGLINVTAETVEGGYHPLKSRNQTDKIYDQIRLIFDIAHKNHISTQRAALRLGDYRLQYGVGRRTKPVFLHHADLSY